MDGLIALALAKKYADKITKTDISAATVTLSQSTYTYDGTSRVPSVTAVTLNGETLTAGTDYAVVSVPATNAGDYSLSVNGIGDYSGVVTANWTISKATPTISGDSSVSIVGTGESVSKTYTTDSDGAFSFSLSDNIAALSNVGGIVTIEATATGSATMTVSVAATSNYTAATKTVSLEITEAQTGTALGVLWDYSLSSPALTRLTPQSDPLGVVTDCPSTEPTACVGTTGGQSEFDNYMPWSGMVRKNYVDGEVVDFTGYDNGETFVYIPEFWSKIVNDTEESKMYIYISSEELTGFTKHPGSGLYMSRYECNSDFLSAPGTAPKVNTNLGGFRTGITAIDNKHYQYDIHTYAALELLYIVEFAHLNTQSKIGAGITSGGTALTIGETDVLTYHTGRVNGAADNVSAVQYRWIENLWGNVWKLVDGILIQDGLVYICNDRANYASSITSDYESTGLYTPTNNNRHKTDQDYDDCYLIPLTTGSSDSTYTCDYYYYHPGLRGLYVGGSYVDGSGAGLFSWIGDGDPSYPGVHIGGRSILILSSGGES